MFDPRNRDASTDEACARLRNVLEQTRGLGRRDFLRVLAEAAAGSVLLSPLVAIAARTAQAAEPPVTYFTYGGAWKQAISAAFFDPFTKKTGIPVQYQEPYTFAKLRAMHEAKAQQIDIAGLSGMDVYIGARIKMISPIDWSLVDKSALDPQQLHHERHRLLKPVDEHLLQQEEVVRCGAPELVGGFLERGEIPGPSRVAARRLLDHGSGGQGRRHQGRRLLSP